MAEIVSSSSTASGNIEGDGSTFTATFKILDGQGQFVTHTFNAKIAGESFNAWRVKDATLDYNGRSDLVGKVDISGTSRIGESYVTLNLRNGNKMTGYLEKRLDTSSAVNGSGTWNSGGSEDD